MSTPADPVLLTEVPSGIEASIIQAKLAEAGVRSVFNGTAISGFAVETPALVRVLVDRGDLPRAREILEARQAGDSATIDWESVDVGEPEDA